MLIVPRISNRVGEQNAHSTIEDFKALKSKATTDELTEKKESDEDGLTTVDSNDPQRDNSTVVQSDNKPVILNNGGSQNLDTTPDFGRLYMDSVVYNEALKQHQGELLVNEQACMTAFAAGDVSSAIESTWNDAKSQIQNVVNNVVFPVLDMILAILFFVKIGSAYFDYRKHGQFEFTAPAILFACLIFTITAPLYIWSVI